MRNRLLIIAIIAILAVSCKATKDSTPVPAMATQTTVRPTPTLATSAPTPVPPTATAKAPDAANATYPIEKLSVTLSNGSAEQPAAPGSATMIRTKLSDKQATGDINNDGKLDTAVILIHSPGGSGTFYYVAAVINAGSDKGTPTNSVLLGDRIVVEKVSVVGNQIVVDYLDRKSGEAMATAPSVKTAKKFGVKDGKLAEIQ